MISSAWMTWSRSSPSELTPPCGKTTTSEHVSDVRLNEVASVTRPRRPYPVVELFFVSEPQRSCLGNKTEASGEGFRLVGGVGLNEVASVTRPRRIGAPSGYPRLPGLNEVASVTRPRRGVILGPHVSDGPAASTKLPR